jgi:hypothetical protein
MFKIKSIEVSNLCSTSGIINKKIIFILGVDDMKREDYNKLVDDLKEEGSFELYYQFLLDYYGSESYGSIYQNLFYQHEQCSSCLNKDDFVEAAMVEDLYHKDLQKLYLIAEAEKPYTDQPLFIALDRYYKVNPSLDDTQDSITERVKEIEEIQRKA